MATAPVPNPILPFWRTEPHKLDTHRSTPELPKECDVLIVGAGFSGVSIAYHLLDGVKNTSDTSIVILEAREACSGATARNGGHLKPDVYFNVPKYTETYGAAAAAELAKFEASQVLAIKEVVYKEKIDCDFQLTRAIDVSLDQAHVDKAEAAFQDLVEAGAESVKDVHFTGKKYAEQISGVKGAKGCFSFTAGHMWPYKFVMHLLDLVVSKGVNLQTNTLVTKIAETPNGDGSWTVTTERGSIRAKKVVLASNGYVAGVAPQYSEKIVPSRGICSRIVVTKGTPPHLTNTYSLRYGPGLYDYLIPRPDGSIVVGGAREKFFHDPKYWYNVTDDSKLIEPAADYFEGYMQKYFRGWENVETKVDRVWTGIMGYTSDYMPHIGDVPKKPNQLIMAGFNGHGMPLIFLCGKGIAEMIRDGKIFEEISVPRIFKTTQERLDNPVNLILGDKPR